MRFEVIPTMQDIFLMRMLGSKTLSQGTTEKRKEDIRIRTKPLTKA